MANIPFTGNYTDVSSQRGFQFKFFCEKCHNGYMSTFQPNRLSTAAAAANAAAGGDPDRDLFDRYVAAKKAMGEDVSGYRLEGFVEGLERERRKVRERFGSADIVFDVAERDGRVRLIARKKPGSGS